MDGGNLKELCRVCIDIFFSMEIIYVVASFQGLLLVGLLLSKKGQSQANLLMGVYMLFIAFTLGVSYFMNTGRLIPTHPVLGLNVGITFLCGPFVWLYARLVTGQAHSLKWRDFSHFLPYLLFTVFAFWVFYARPLEIKSALIARGSESWVIKTMIWSNGVKIAHSLVYYYFTFALINQRAHWLPNISANGNLMTLKWLRWLLALLTVISAVMAIWFSIYMATGTSIFTPFAGNLINLLLFVLVYVMAGFALKHPRLFGQGFLMEHQNDEPKYHKSTMTQEEGNHIWEGLNRVMAEEKPYLNPDLNMADLVEQLGYSMKQLSQVINQHSGNNFFSYINQYRVEEFKQEVGRPENAHLTLVAIALGCGFASKSSFYAIFKKMEGITPGRYLKSIRLQLTPQ